MIKLSTPIIIDPLQNKATYKNKFLFVGSCFTENMGNKMALLGFDTFINPVGILYNPVSILHCLQFIIQNKPLSTNDLFFHNELWHSYYHHGKFSSTAKEQCLDNCNSHIQNASAFLKQTNWLIITLGSAWLHSHKKNGLVAGNCHKLPAANFEKSLLDLDTATADYVSIIQQLKEFNPKLNILFTVSPVRHWNDGFRENQISKSILHLLVHNIQQQFPTDVFYFPAYEIVMDELRDYRFYDTDMLHPNTLAIDFIWEKLKDFIFTPETHTEIEEVENFRKMFLHRSLYPDTEAYKKHQEKVMQVLAQLKSQRPTLNFDGILQKDSSI